MPVPTPIPWPDAEPLSEDAILLRLRDEGLAPLAWGNAPGDRYTAHSHPYHKVLYCVRGSIRFLFDETGAGVDLTPGDRLEIAPGTVHAAAVGPAGVTCIEAHRA